MSRLLPLMLLRRLCILLTAVSLRAQSPDSLSPQDGRVAWERPDVNAPLFDATAVGMDAEARAELVRSLLLLVRNLPDGATVTTALRSQALGVVLRLDPGNPAALIANGQFARGVRPLPLAVDAAPTADSVAARLVTAARSLLEAPENAAHRLAYLLFDLARRLDPLRERDIALFTYGTTITWPGPLAPEPPLWAAPELRVMSGSVRFLLSTAKDHPGLFTVQAQAEPGKPGQRLQAVLPPDLLKHMADEKQKPLRDDIEQRSLAMRDMLLRRHDVWPEGWRVQFTFSQDPRPLLPHAFAGMGVVLDAMLNDQPLDTRCLVAGWVDASGEFSGHLHADDAVMTAAELDALLVLPKQATGEILDWLLARPAMWTVLTRVTVIRAGNLADVMAVAHAEKAGKLAESFAAFEQIAAPLRTAEEPLTLLRNPDTIARLRTITEIHPQHLNADILLRIATRQMPRYLSLRGSLRQLSETAEPLLSTDRVKYPLNKKRKPLDKTVFSTTGANLASMKSRLHPKSLPFLTNLLALANALHQASGGGDEPAASRAARSKALSTRRSLETLAE